MNSRRYHIVEKSCVVHHTKLGRSPFGLGEDTRTAKTGKPTSEPRHACLVAFVAIGLKQLVALKAALGRVDGIDFTQSYP